MKAAFESFAKILGLDCRVVKRSHPSMIDGRCAELFLGKERVGFIGEIHPEVLLNFGIEEPATAFEIDLSGWLADGKGEEKSSP
jgi:phenylalanyl-tRNA synthetase beta chain